MKHWTTQYGLKVYRINNMRGNAYLVQQANQFLLIDTGAKSLKKKLLKSLKELGVTQENLKAIIVTHTHYDHVTHVALIQKLFKLQVLAQYNEVANLQRGKSPDIGGSIRLTKYLEGILNEGIKIVGNYPPVIQVESVEQQLDLKEFGFRVQIIATPGHSKGSISVIVDREIALVGDAMFGVVPGSIYPPYAVDIQEMISSWKKLLNTGAVLYLPGHGQARTRSCVVQQYNKYQRKYDNKK